MDRRVRKTQSDKNITDVKLESIANSIEKLINQMLANKRGDFTDELKKKNNAMLVRLKFKAKYLHKISKGTNREVHTKGILKMIQKLTDEPLDT